MSLNVSQYEEFIPNLVAKSGAVIRSYYGRKELHVQRKKDASVVTQADKEAELVLREEIKKAFPTHGIIGEEFGSENERAEFVWVLDPIDGTISFVRGCPLFGTLVALTYQGQPIVGAIHQPILNELCIGNGETTKLDGDVVKMSEILDLSEATLLTTDVDNIGQYKSHEAFKNLREQTQMFRTWGDCYGYILLAKGTADIMLDAIMNPWDLQALVPIIRGAGGVITTWEGGDPSKGNSIVASNKYLHKQVLKTLNG